MALRELFSEVAAGWADFHELERDDKSHPMHQLVVNEFPTAMRDAAVNPTEMLFQGSVGRGILTYAPWMACFHTALTSSAQDEYYVVYLFSVDLEVIVLELGFGITQFQNRFGRNRGMMEQLRQACASMQQRAADYRTSIFSEELNRRVSLDAADLRAKNISDLHEGYEQSAIFHVTYSLADLPAEEVLVSDLNQFLHLYRQMAEDPSIPAVGDLAWADAKAPTQTELFPVTEFVPRQKARSSGGNSSGGASRDRRSKRADKIGREAEEYVFEQERKKLVQMGRSDLADQVNWHRDDPTDRTPGWDITSFDEQGEKVLIEVKGTVEKTISTINLTPNEWAKAQLPRNRTRYLIYLVTEALTNPAIEILRNPAQWVDDGELKITVSEWQLDLRN